jgi:hypothetical protein
MPETRCWQEECRVELGYNSDTQRLIDLALALHIPPGPEFYPTWLAGEHGSNERAEFEIDLIDAHKDVRMPWSIG